MAGTGNAVANSYWEAKLGSQTKPHYESSDLEPFIRRKYCNKEFAEGTWPPALPDEATPATTAGSRSSANPVAAGSTTPQLRSDPSAGRLEAGGFWGSLTPQESGVATDLLSDTPLSASLTPVRPQQQRQSRQPIYVDADSPPLLIDLMDFGAESTFQLPTTPRRQTGSAFGSAAGASAANAAVSGVSSSSSGSDMGRGATNGTSSRANGDVIDSRQASGKAAGPSSAGAAAQPELSKQQSSFPLLPPPPQVKGLAFLCVCYA